MPKHLFIIAACLLLSVKSFAQSYSFDLPHPEPSLTIADLIKLTEAKNDSVAVYLQAKKFQFYSKSSTGPKSFVYIQKAGSANDMLSKTEDINSSGAQLCGVTYMYDDKLSTQKLTSQLIRLSFQLKDKITSDGCTTLVYSNDKYNASVRTYTGTGMSSSVTIEPADKRRKAN